MRVTGAGKAMVLAVLGLALLTTAGCVGGSKNFSTGGGVVQAASPSSSDPASRVAGARVGNLAPDFALKALDGSTVRLSDLRGKSVFVNFWATWCPPCREEMPALEKVYQKYRDQGVVFLGVDMKENAETVRKFVQENRYSWTFLLDTDGRVANSYQVSGVPTSFFIDREGVIRDFQIGPMSAGLLEAKLGKAQ